MNRYLYIIILIVWWVGIDLYSKSLSLTYLEQRVDIFWGYMYFHTVKNTGIAFSFPLEWIVLKVITLVLIFWIIYYYIKEEKKKKSLLVDTAFASIIGGAIWNGYERIVYWEVVDFIWMKYFAIFNLADTFISIWALLYIIHILSTYKNK